MQQGIFFVQHPINRNHTPGLRTGCGIMDSLSSLSFLARNENDFELRKASLLCAGSANDVAKLGNENMTRLYTASQVKYGGIRRSSASPRPPCDVTPSASVWPSPMQTSGPPCLYPQIPPSQPRSMRAAPRHGPVSGFRQGRFRWAGYSVGNHAICP